MSITSIIPTRYLVINSVLAFAFGYFFPFLTILLFSFAIGRELAKNKN